MTFISRFAFVPFQWHWIRMRNLLKYWLSLILAGLSVSCVYAAPPAPTPDDGQIGFVVGKLLDQEHYSRAPLDDTKSQQFLRMYLDDLDYNHLFFLQSDIQDFQKYETVLDDAILHSDVQPGFDVFNRYVKRVEERVKMAKELLKQPFTFDTDESIVIDRHTAPWPVDEADARRLWRLRIKYELLQEKLNKKKPSEMIDTVTRRYDRLLRNLHEEDSESVLHLFLTSLARSYDPHSEYLPPTDLNNFAINMKLSLVGIGALLTSEDGYPKVMAVVPGGPADLDKRLKVNDRIAGVAQGSATLVDVLDMKLSKAVELIRGEKNTDVRLSIIPAEATDPATRVEITLKRDEIKLTEAEAKAKVIEIKDEKHKIHRVGYIDLPQFYSDMQVGPESKRSSQDVARLLEKLNAEKVEGVILDLRRNGGGALTEAIDLSGLFIRSGPILQVKNSKGGVKKYSDDDSSLLYGGPLVVLTSHVSASASEIVAAALQDYGRAVVVGDKSTFGKGTVQKVEDLGRILPLKEAGGGALKVTVQKFYRISGQSTQYRGVIPDIQLPSQLDYLKINEASLPNPLPYDEVTPCSYTMSDRLITLIPELRKHSMARVAKDPEFDYIRQDIERLKPQLEDKTVSLNEARRLEEKKANEDRIKQRKDERQARKSSDWKVTEITLASITGAATNTPALTKKILEEAAQRESSDDPLGNDPDVDPELDESVNIVLELAQKWTVADVKP